MKKIPPEREIEIEFMAKKPEYSCDILVALAKFQHAPKCKVWEALRELWEDRELMKEEIKQLNERR